MFGNVKKDRKPFSWQLDSTHDAMRLSRKGSHPFGKCQHRESARERFSIVLDTRLIWFASDYASAVHFTVGLCLKASEQVSHNIVQ